MFCNPQSTTCVSFCLRERESREGREGNSGSNFGRPRCPGGGGGTGTCKTRPRNKRGGALSVTGLPSRHVAQRPRRCQKNLARSRSCSAARHTRARVAATCARAPARAVGRRNGGGNPERFPPEQRVPPTRSVSNPKQFCLPGSLASPPPFALSECTYGPFCPSISPVSQTPRPPTRSVSNPKPVCQPGSFAPLPTHLARFSSSFRYLPGSL
jgi:hypothetical protein